MYRIEARIICNYKNGKVSKHEWFRWGKNYKTIRRVIQALVAFKKDKWFSRWGKGEDYIYRTAWEYRPVHYYL